MTSQCVFENQPPIEVDLNADDATVFISGMVTCCGIVLFFLNSGKIVAYHISGMCVNQRVLDLLAGAIQGRPVLKMMVFSNKFPDRETGEQYKNEAFTLRDAFHPASSEYYTTSEIKESNIIVKIKRNGRMSDEKFNHFMSF